MRLPFEASLDDREPKFYAMPQPQLPQQGLCSATGADLRPAGQARHLSAAGNASSAAPLPRRLRAGDSRRSRLSRWRCVMPARARIPRRASRSAVGPCDQLVDARSRRAQSATAGSDQPVLLIGLLDFELASDVGIAQSHAAAGTAVALCRLACDRPEARSWKVDGSRAARAAVVRAGADSARPPATRSRFASRTAPGGLDCRRGLSRRTGCDRILRRGSSPSADAAEGRRARQDRLASDEAWAYDAAGNRWTESIRCC